MFWKFNNGSSSQIEAVLAKQDVTLQELMEEEDIINECKLQNKSLIEFLAKPEILEELVTLTTIEPPTELEERSRFKYSNIACEILTCDVPSLNERLASDETLLNKLYMFLDSEPPLNPLLASFFSKIMGALIVKKTEQNWLSYQLTCLQVLDFLKAKDNFVSLLLKHLGTSAVMDLTLKLMTQVEGQEVRPNVLNWLDNERVMQSLVSLLDPSVDKERHFNVAQLLCDFIKVSRDTLKNSTERSGNPDPLLNTLESPETVSLLLDHMLGGEIKSETCIVGGIEVLLVLLDVNRVSCEEVKDTEQKQVVVENTALAVLKRLGDFHGLLLDPPKKPSINTTIGVLDPPLGNTRLQVTRLFAAVISTNNPQVLTELISLGTMQVLLDLFFAFPWNNFLHTQVQACITSALKAHIPSETGDDNALYKHLIVNCKLVERILEAWKDNDAWQAETKGVRQGYMGHLTNIANSVGELCSTGPLGQFIKDNLPEVAESFDKFNEGTLAEIKKTQAILLGGSNPNTSNEGSDDYGDVPFQQSNLMHQQIFTQYQIHQLTTQFVESYGFNDEDFNDGDDTLQNIDHRMGMNFVLSEGDLVQQHELFKQVCAQNINTLDDADDQIFEDRDHTFQTIIEKPGERHDAAVYSSDSDEEDSPPNEDPFMDIDPWATSNRESESAVALISMEDPWSMNEKPAAEANTGWASFSSPSFANFEANFDSTDDDNKQKMMMMMKKKSPVMETDLKVENVEVVDNNSKMTSSEQERSNNNINNESIENVAQVIVENEKKIFKDNNINVAAAGEQGHHGIVNSTNSTPKVDVQPPLMESKSNMEEDSCKLQPQQETTTGSTGTTTAAVTTTTGTTSPSAARTIKPSETNHEEEGI